jgi:catecholate siderophore receptor
MLRRHLIAALNGLALSAAPAFAETPMAADPAIEADPTEDEQQREIVVIGEYLGEELSLPQQVLPLLDTPQTVTVITDDLLQEQGRRTLRDAMRNITGVSFQAGEGNPPGGGDAFNIRGFSARDDIFVDGLRDPGNYFRDPFYAERIEVTKGPASAFAGRGNVGGTVNIVTRSPQLRNLFNGEAVIGTDNFYRGTADANVVLDQANGIAARLTAMAHSNDEPGRDHVYFRRFAVAPSVAFGLGGDTRVTLSYLHLQQDDRPDLGLPNARNPSLTGSPFAGRVAPVDRNNFYGYANDYRDVTTNSITARIEHRFSDALEVSNATRYVHVKNDQIIHAPRFVGNVTTLGPATQVVGNSKPRLQTDQLFVNQTNATARFDTGFARHTLVAGVEVTEESNENIRRLDSNGPAMDLFDPVLVSRPDSPFNGTRARIDLDTLAFYLFDTIELGDQWRVVGGLRWDRVETRVRGFDDNNVAPGFVTDLSRTDEKLSGNAALVFKPTPASSLYVAYGTSFEPGSASEVVQLAGGNNNPPVTPASFFVDPETSWAIEAGGKIDLLDDALNLSGAVFQITRGNARTPGLNPGDPAVVLDGEQRVRGFEVQLVGRVTPRWNVFAGYTYLDGKVTKSNRAFEVGQRLDQTPEHSLSSWTSYAITDRLLLGGGVQHVSSRTSDIRQTNAANIVITAPAYTVFDAFAEYKLDDRFGLRLNVYNVADEVYFASFGSAQSIPAPARSATLTLTVGL